jgi:hypothetical protein
MVKKTMKNYTLKSGRIVKEMIIKPDKANGVFTYKDIMNFVNTNIKNVAPHKRVVVRALNILGDRTLDTFNTTIKSRNDLKMLNEDEFDEYTKNKVKDSSHFKHFFSFSITISEDPDEDGFMFHKK